VAILEKAGCDHVKTTANAEAAFSIDDTKDPWAEVTLMGGKFYSDVWVNGGRELAHEIIKKNEKDTHDAREEARRTKEAAERERHIGIVFWILTSVLALWLRTNSLSFTTELSPLSEPYNPLADPEMKEALDVMNLANSIIDEVVDKLLNEATEKILREEYTWCMEQLTRHVNYCNIFLYDAWNLHTYRFWAFGEKTPSLLFMLHKERNSLYSKSDKTIFPEAYFVPQHIFILTKHLPKICFVFNFCAVNAIWCMM
jgi:hypothetical protein